MPKKSTVRPKAKSARTQKSRVKVTTVRAGSGGVGDIFRNKLSLAIFVLAFVVVGVITVRWTQAATTTSTLWPSNTIPKTITDSDTKSVELGVKFKAKYSGNVTGVRFYKGAQNTGTHVGNLWAKNGVKLASVTFKNETASGWQEAAFDKPVAIAANTTYVVSYFAPNGRYSSDGGYFKGKAYTSGPLTALKDGSQGGNGVYIYSSKSGFPLQTYNASNYWVDVVFNTSTFNPTVKPAAPSNLKATVSGSTATLTWQNSPTNGVVRHDVYRDGKVVGASGVGQFADKGLLAGSTHTYYVVAVESAANMSDASNSVKVSIPDDVPPTTPTPPTTPPTPTTPPNTSGFPGGSTTGYKSAPGYPGSLTPFTGKLESGKTYRYMSFDSGFGVENVNDVTFYGCLFKGNDSAFANVIMRGSNNITFDYASFVPDPARYAAPPASGQIPYNGSSQFGLWLYPDGAGKIMVDHSDFWGFGNGIQFFSSTDPNKTFTVRNSWFHDARDDGNGQ
ncbi:MAG TPA: DUF4082 domain-containing protein, partial [Candidatus Saccharimonadales bacterium]|nr:DUF4082 domain-containing protein [Candidatus Saccharimonadales bacterium]